MESRTYYHATCFENGESIYESGTLISGADGCVHLTTNLNKALMFMKMRGLDRCTVFRLDPDFLDESKIEPFYDGLLSGSDCYVHDGDVVGVEWVETFNFNPPKI